MKRPRKHSFNAKKFKLLFTQQDNYVILVIVFAGSLEAKYEGDSYTSNFLRSCFCGKAIAIWEEPDKVGEKLGSDGLLDA